MRSGHFIHTGWPDSLILVWNALIINSIGSILCYSYSRLGAYKIKNMDKLKESKNRIFENNVDVVSDYYNCLNEKNY